MGRGSRYDARKRSKKRGGKMSTFAEMFLLAAAKTMMKDAISKDPKLIKPLEKKYKPRKRPKTKKK